MLSVLFLNATVIMTASTVIEYSMFSLCQALGKDGAVPLSNSLSLADRHRISALTKESREKEYSDTCPFRYGRSCHMTSQHRT